MSRGFRHAFLRANKGTRREVSPVRDDAEAEARILAILAWVMVVRGGGQ